MKVSSGLRPIGDGHEVAVRALFRQAAEARRRGDRCGSKKFGYVLGTRILGRERVAPDHCDRRRRSLRRGARIDRAARHAAVQRFLPARCVAATAALVGLNDEICDAELLLLTVVHHVEDLGLVADKFVARDLAIMVGVYLAKHFLGS